MSKTSKTKIFDVAMAPFFKEVNLKDFVLGKDFFGGRGGGIFRPADLKEKESRLLDNKGKGVGL